jgi:signal transduction histidine kinase
MQVAAPHSELARLEHERERLVADARVLLAAIALGMGPFGPPGGTGICLLLGAYLTYALLHWTCNTEVRRAFSAVAHWIDMVCYCTVVAVTGGLGSRYLLFLLFPLAVVAFHYQTRRSIHLALFFMLLFVGMGVAQGSGTGLPVSAETAGPLAGLLVSGLMLARWAHSEVLDSRRLAASSDLNRIFNPHSKLDDALEALAELLRGHHAANLCVVILDGEAADRRLYVADGQPGRCASLEPQIGEYLASVMPGKALVYRSTRWPFARPVAAAYDAQTLKRESVDPGALVELAELLETRSFVCMPVRSRTRLLGRCFIASERSCFDRADLQLLGPVLEPAGMMVENLQLIDRVSDEIVRRERSRISRDLHDSTLQPYLGLKLGLEALRRRMTVGDRLSREVDELIAMAADSIGQLRSYMGGLKADARRKPHLLAAVRAEITRFSGYYGVRTGLAAESDITVPQPLAEDVIFLVREGLSNIRRHTRATSADVRLSEKDGWLMLEIVNDHGPVAQATGHFTPRSMTERAVLLGGNLAAASNADETVVSVRLPL